MIIIYVLTSTLIGFSFGFIIGFNIARKGNPAAFERKDE